MNRSESSFDVVVVGGGVLGTFHAYHALKAGLRVALLERNSCPMGATVRNFGQVVPSGLNTAWQALGRESLGIYRDLQPALEGVVHHAGSVYLASNEDEELLLQELAEINRGNDYISHIWSGHFCREQVNGVRPEYARAGLYFPEELNLDPRQAIHRILAFLCEQEGLIYHPQHFVNEIKVRENGVRVHTSTGHSFDAEHVIVCSGTEFGALFPSIFRESDIKLVKLQMLETKPQHRQRFAQNILTGRTIRRYEAFQECASFGRIKANEPTLSFAHEFGVHILFKQTDTGSVILGDSHEYASVQDADELGFDGKNSINCFLLEQAMRIMDLETWEIDRTWNGYYCQREHGDYFKMTLEDRIHIVTAIGGKGMTVGPAFAKKSLRELGILSAPSTLE